MPSSGYVTQALFILSGRLTLVPKANAIKFIRLKPATAVKVNKSANRFWLFGIMFSIVHSLVKVRFDFYVFLSCPQLDIGGKIGK